MGKSISENRPFSLGSRSVSVGDVLLSFFFFPCAEIAVSLRFSRGRTFSFFFFSLSFLSFFVVVDLSCLLPLPPFPHCSCISQIRQFGPPHCFWTARSGLLPIEGLNTPTPPVCMFFFPPPSRFLSQCSPCLIQIVPGVSVRECATLFGSSASGLLPDLLPLLTGRRGLAVSDSPWIFSPSPSLRTMARPGEPVGKVNFSVFVLPFDSPCRVGFQVAGFSSPLQFCRGLTLIRCPTKLSEIYIPRRCFFFPVLPPS